VCLRHHQSCTYAHKHTHTPFCHLLLVPQTSRLQVCYDFEMCALDPEEAAVSTHLPKNQGSLVVHGMFLEGCGWNAQAGRLCESEPKVRQHLCLCVYVCWSCGSECVCVCVCAGVWCVRVCKWTHAVWDLKAFWCMACSWRKVDWMLVKTLKTRYRAFALSMS